MKADKPLFYALPIIRAYAMIPIFQPAFPSLLSVELTQVHNGVWKETLAIALEKWNAIVINHMSFAWKGT